MKKKIIYVLSFILLMSGCSKVSRTNILTPENRKFFSTEKVMFDEVQKAILNFDKSEILKKIDDTKFFDKGENSIAIIFFTSSKGEGSIAIEKKYDSRTKTFLTDPVKEISCSGRCAGNKCQIRSVMKDGVLDYVECTCGDCEMHIITSPSN